MAEVSDLGRGDVSMSSFEEHVRRFAGLPVRRFHPKQGIIRPEATCQFIGRTFGILGDAVGDLNFDALLDRFLAKPSCSRIAGIAIGPWWDDSFGDLPSSSGVVAKLVAARDRLPGLRAIYLGDITREEAEIAWIQQSDVTPLLHAFPALEHLRVRGSGPVESDPESGSVPNNRLRFRAVEHASLRSLIIETGCLPADVSRGVAASRLPVLEHLEVWLGDDSSEGCENSGDTAVEDLVPLFSGEGFPSLRSLAIRNSHISDEVAVALAGSLLLRRLEVLDLSLGTLSDRGALALLHSGALGRLKRLDIHHHYVSEEVADGLLALGIDLDASGREEDEGGDDDDEEDDEEDRYDAVDE
jgi:hypothetical protein